MLKKQVLIHLFIYGIVLAVLAKLLPWVTFVPLVIVVVFVHLYIANGRKQRRYLEVVESLKHVYGDSAPRIGTGGDDVDQAIFETLKELAGELEKRSYQLVEKNIQLLSLKEIGLSLISSLSEDKIVQAVISYLAKGLGYKEFFVAVYEGRARSFRFRVVREGPLASEDKTIEAAIGEMDGLVGKALEARSPLLIRDAAMHPLGKVKGEDIFPASTMTSFLLAPMTKSTVPKECWREEVCLLEDKRRGKIDLGTCPDCTNFPLLGLIGVTDGFKGEPLGSVDLVSVETIALQAGTTMENSQLYRGLAEEEKFRRNIIDSMGQGLVTIDGKGCVKLANRTAERISGYGADELIGTKIDRIIVDSSAGEGPVSRALKAAVPSFRKEAWLVKKDGERVPILLNTSFLVGGGEEVEGMLVVFSDVTRIKRMEEKIVHLDKLAALGRLSSSIAHEIRNPLTGIAAGIQYLRRMGTLSAEQDENVDFILREVDRIDRLIADLMDVARMGDLIYQKVRLERLVENSIQSLQGLIEEKRVKVVVTFAPEPREVEVDPDRITQVLINLLKNAVEASADGDEVRVEVTFPQEAPDVLFDGLRDYAMIRVSDRGVGMSEEEKKKIFEPFYSRKSKGAGLGLYVVHSIVERHGGYVLVESEKGIGATFTIYLPTERV